MAFAISSALTKRRSETLESASSRAASGVIPRAAALLANTASIRAPATDPGQMALTRMPNRPSSIDSDFVNPITPHFVAA